MQLFFLRYNRLWSVFVPVLGELVLILYLTGLKLHFDGVGPFEGVPPPLPVAEGALINLSSDGGGADICINDQPEEESSERVFIFPGSSAQVLEPLLGDQDQGRPAEVSHEGATHAEANKRTEIFYPCIVETMKQHATDPTVQMYPLILPAFQVYSYERSELWMHITFQTIGLGDRAEDVIPDRSAPPDRKYPGKRHLRKNLFLAFHVLKIYTIFPQLESPKRNIPRCHRGCNNSYTSY